MSCYQGTKQRRGYMTMFFFCVNEILTFLVAGENIQHYPSFEAFFGVQSFSNVKYESSITIELMSETILFIYLL